MNIISNLEFSHEQGSLNILLAEYILDNFNDVKKM